MFSSKRKGDMVFSRPVQNMRGDVFSGPGDAELFSGELKGEGSLETIMRCEGRSQPCCRFMYQGVPQ